MDARWSLSRVHWGTGIVPRSGMKNLERILRFAQDDACGAGVTFPQGDFASGGEVAIMNLVSLVSQKNKNRFSV